MPKSNSLDQPNRRCFLKTSGAVMGAAVAGTLSVGRAAHAAGSDVLKVGLIGCGGRGTGAAANALTADPNTQLVAMADAFPNRWRRPGDVEEGLWRSRHRRLPRHCFVGFDAYQKVIDSGVDVVLPGRDAPLPPHAPEGRHRRRQARLLREAGGRRRPGHPQRPGDVARRPRRRT